MSSIKEVREKIESIRNIQKLSKAMEMIAASKMKKAQRLMLVSQPYTKAIRKVIDHISLGKLEYRHVYLMNREVRSVGYWVISSDRGLAGGLNVNVFRMLLNDISRWNKLNVTIKLAIIGSKAISFFNCIDPNMIVSYVSGIGDVPKMSQLIGLVGTMLQLYCNGQVDRLYLIYNKFINTLSQVPKIIQILPIFSESNNTCVTKHWDYLYEPDSKVLLDTLLNRYIESQVYQGVVENLASEQSARMIAMKTASDNGETIIKDLRVFYNKLRQSKITQELAEIISGSSVI
ncbi:ATP synthase gamma subunit [Candidatus Blochmanniella floridana]|uniref:ATP synthase gamma chain n=1 Tax=Blochmanniella floridana TaxID=203907 RepID=ATPG_BLOFL|nr:RecName: Full=ATP synthase gamma chain; AltName: Full=ATP synthase F1 sector gamma subunit; AltName: Full=F-ATPase gamma subunit [Candidatus Blochmannia floridanus]CAD83535.1 ATP synthase gamma subunit [Candidatus Blochmannia floridanus]